MRSSQDTALLMNDAPRYSLLQVACSVRSNPQHDHSRHCHVPCGLPLMPPALIMLQGNSTAAAQALASTQASGSGTTALASAIASALANGGSNAAAAAQAVAQAYALVGPLAAHSIRQWAMSASAAPAYTCCLQILSGPVCTVRSS